MRRDRQRAVEVAAQAAGVRAVAPLAACFLPAFLLLGVVPVVASLAGDSSDVTRRVVHRRDATWAPAPSAPSPSAARTVDARACDPRRTTPVPMVGTAAAAAREGEPCAR